MFDSYRGRLLSQFGFTDEGEAFNLVVQVGQRLVDDCCEGIDFLGAQCVEDQAAHGVDMTWCRHSD